MHKVTLATVASLLWLSGPVGPAAAGVPLPVPRPGLADRDQGARLEPSGDLPLPVARPANLGTGAGWRSAGDSIGGVPIPRPRPAGLGADALLNAGDRRLALQALAAAKGGKWRQVRRLADRIQDSLAARLVTWIYLTEANLNLPFAELSGFVEANPLWPRQSVLIRRAEASMGPGLDTMARLAWFDRHPPLSGVGQMTRADALARTGRTSQAGQLARLAWIHGNFPRRAEQRYYKRWRHVLRRPDHIARLDRLLWEGRTYPSRRMNRRVNKDWRLLAAARLALRRRSGGVDRAIARVPARLRNDPGLIYERLRWRRRKGLHERAQEILLEVRDRTVQTRERSRPEKWWVERAFQTRKAFEAGNHALAYRLVNDHSLTHGAAFAEAEWLAGWLALRYLDKPKVAYGHFMRLHDVVRLPISVARANYWAGRAADAYGENDLAGRWYLEASRHPTTFYGQMAAQKIISTAPLMLPADPGPKATEVAGFNTRDLVHAVRLLVSLGAGKRITPFIIKLYEAADTPGAKMLVATLAHSVGRLDLGVRISKAALGKGVFMPTPGYPVIELPELPVAGGRPLEAAFVLALSRQESAFGLDAHSRAGARGLMQLMPATARVTARALKIGYAPGRLNDADYNATLGMAHLASLLERYEGSYVLALAAYNAGQSRADRWIRVFGDPRHPDVDSIDWIETIPFSETRNYIQRVMENLQVYRVRLADRTVQLRLAQDIERAARAAPFFAVPEERPRDRFLPALQ